MTAALEQIVGHFTPLTVSGGEWHGACLQCDGALAVIGQRWRCADCGCHDADDTALGFLRLTGLSAEEAQHKLDNGTDWEPRLSKPAPPLPRWGLHRVADDPRPVLIVDTREAAKAAEERLPGYLTVLWPGGGSRWDRLEPLRSRQILLWPTIDGLGIMERLESVLADPRGLACTGSFIVPSDLAPWEDTTERIIAWAKERKRPLQESAPQLNRNQEPSLATNPVAAGAPKNQQQQVADGVSAQQSAQPEQSGNATEVAPLPPATPAPADAGFGIESDRYRPNGPSPVLGVNDGIGPLEIDLSDAEPPPTLDTDFPPNAAKSPRKRRSGHLRAVDSGNLALAPDQDAEPVADMPVEMGEDALALHFAAQHGADTRYVKAWDRWYRYDGDGWRPDTTEEVSRLAVEMCRQAINWPQAGRLTEDQRRKIARRATSSAVRDMARTDRRIAASVDQWDSDPMLVGIPGGVFDVDTGKVVLGERENYITKRTAVAPADGAPAMWLAHLNRMMAGDATMVDFLQLFAGYCATGDVSEQVFAFLYGMGQTGKGTFLLTIGELLGDYAVFSEASTFLKRNQDKHLSELARFNGARLVIIDELPSGSVWNEERIKRVTGGGKLTVNYMHSDPFDMQIRFKLAVASNSKPSLRRVGKEMERRIRLIRTAASIPDDEVDKKFRARMLAQEGPQILNWILQGAVNWKQSGLTYPEKVQVDTQDYLQSVDLLGDWLEECTDQSGETARPDAYANFKAWLVKQGNEHAWGPQAWWSAMEDRGYTIRRSSVARYVKGLSIKLGANL